MNIRGRLKWWFQILRNGIFYPLSGLVPRSTKRWAFGFSPSIFGGNPKYLFLWISLHRPDIQVTWLTASDSTARMLRAEGYRAYRRNSPRGINAALRAGVYVFAHTVASVNVQLSRGALLLNLWHGVGLKAIHFKYPGGRTALARRQAASGFLWRIYNLGYLLPPDVLVTTSDMMQAHFADQFELPPERCPQLGYPRLDFATDGALNRIARSADVQAGFTLNPGCFTEIYIYMPTFRDTERPFLDQALPDLHRLSAVLRARNALLYLKPHPRTVADFRSPHDNIRFWPAKVDFNTYLANFTGLITDYSSVLYDYLAIHGTGAILYTFDLETYLANDRAFLYPFEENVVGLRVKTFDALCHALRDGAALEPAIFTDLDRIRERFWGGATAPASPAIVAYVERVLADRRGAQGRTSKLDRS